MDAKELIIGKVYRKIDHENPTVYDSLFIYEGEIEPKPHNPKYFNIHQNISKYRFVDAKTGLNFRFKPEDMMESIISDGEIPCILVSEQNKLHRLTLALSHGYITTIEFLKLRKSETDNDCYILLCAMREFLKDLERSGEFYFSAIDIDVYAENYVSGDVFKLRLDDLLPKITTYITNVNQVN